MRCPITFQALCIAKRHVTVGLTTEREPKRPKHLNNKAHYGNHAELYSEVWSLVYENSNVKKIDCLN